MENFDNVIVLPKTDFRTIEETFKWVTSGGKNRAITKYRIRQLALDGRVSTLKVGNKIIIDIFSLKNYLENQCN